MGVDIDPLAVEAARANVQLNGYSDAFEVGMKGNGSARWQGSFHGILPSLHSRNLGRMIELCVCRQQSVSKVQSP